MTIYAKSDPRQSLHCHLTEVRTASKILLTPARRQAFARLGIGEMQAEELLLSTAWLHDWGKATDEWQRALLAGRKLPQHSLTGFFACLWALGINKIEEIPLDLLALALAVLGHHGQLSNGSFRSENFRESLTIPWDAWQELWNELPLRGNRPKSGPASISALLACDKVGHAKTYCGRLPADTAFRGLYCLLLTMLVQSDHAASGGHAPEPQSITPPHVPGELTYFQKDVQHKPGQVLCAVAGCGSGKTAAALLRTAEFAEVQQADRIVLCLPTRFTSNSLLRDMSDAAKYAYPNKDVGLVHSEALQVLRLRTNNDEEDFPGTPEELASKSIRYEMPVTISTVDHLLMSLYHGYKFADRAFGNLLSSLVVFDEVHAYDTTTLNAIREGLNVLTRHGVPSLFLSATLPSSRRRFFGLSQECTVLETDNPYYPFYIQKLAEPLTIGKGNAVQASQEARQCLREASGLKLAIYVNQVERAKSLARAAREELPEVQVFCYHSELRPIDRQSLEKQIIDAFHQDQPIVLVATQAAELSLDISAERMITELAPADVLVQRGGRLNRRGLLPDLAVATSRLAIGFQFWLLIAPLELTLNDDGSCPAALPYQDPALLSNTWDTAPLGQAFTFAIGLDWCETILADEPQKQKNGLEAASLKDAAFGKKPQENYSGEENPDGVVIRDIDDDIKLVIPERYLGDLPNSLIELAQVQVSIRRRKFFAVDPGLVEKQTRPIVIRQGKETKIIDYEITIIKSNLPYDPVGGGFDFRVGEGVLRPQQNDDNFCF